MIDRPCHRLGTDLQQRALKSGDASLQAYAALCKQNLEVKRVNYKLRPKWHAYCHMVFAFRDSDENPRGHKTLAEESMLGYLTKLASACHGRTVVIRFFQRFSLFLALHWDNIARGNLD